MESISQDAIKYLVHIKRVWLDKFGVFEMDDGLKVTQSTNQTTQSNLQTTFCFMTFVLS